MVKVVNDDIYLTRGDTFVCSVKMIKDDGTEYTPTGNDSVRFALKKTAYDRKPLILKTIPNDTLKLTITPDDTKKLDFGDYIYDIELTTENGVVDTFIADAGFNLMVEVH